MTSTEPIEAFYTNRHGHQLEVDHYPGDGPTVVVVTGGGFVEGDEDRMGADCRRFQAQGYDVWAPMYRLVPRDQPAPWWPGSVDDVRDFLGGIGNGGALYLYGVSAGGCLVLHLAADPTLLELRAVVSISGATNLNNVVAQAPRVMADELRQLVVEGLGCAKRACPDLWAEASPINHVHGDMAPVLTVHAANELVSYRQGTQLRAAITEAGGEAAHHTAPGDRHGLTMLERTRHALAWFAEHTA